MHTRSIYLGLSLSSPASQRLPENPSDVESFFQNVNPATTVAEILKRRDDVLYSCNSILNKPKPKVTASSKTDAPPPPAKEDQAPAAEEETVPESEGPDASVEELD
jgi:heat shock protein 4